MQSIECFKLVLTIIVIVNNPHTHKIISKRRKGIEIKGKNIWLFVINTIHYHILSHGISLIEKGQFILGYN